MPLLPLSVLVLAALYGAGVPRVVCDAALFVLRLPRVGDSGGVF